ncbi:MAG: phosphoribosyltransferase family protein [Bacteroidota bacterium]
MSNNLILTQNKVDQIVQRVAYQIHENNMEQTVSLVGVDAGGRRLADSINETLSQISGSNSQCFTITLDKEEPLINDISLDGNLSDLEKKAVVLCDDVLSTGKTLSFCMAKLLSLNVTKVETAVLILRSHAKFPIYATYVGYELSTTVREHVEVRANEGVFLN